MASFEKRGSKWRFKIHYNDNLGRKNILVNLAFRTKQEAKRAAVELESKINKGYKEEKLYSKKNGRITILKLGEKIR